MSDMMPSAAQLAAGLHPTLPSFLHSSSSCASVVMMVRRGLAGGSFGLKGAPLPPSGLSSSVLLSLLSLASAEL
jgi:hypothetical protein